MEYFIGIECVGMRICVGVIADRSGTILAARRFPFGLSLHATPHGELTSRLLEILIGLSSASTVPLDDMKRSTTCIGMTGATFPYDWKVRLRDLFDEIEFIPEELICTGDAEIVFASHARTKLGSAIICHSGSTAFLWTAEETRRLGGWGPVLGDEGSGYWMGRRALRVIGHEHDRRQSESTLWNEINQWLSNPSDELAEWQATACEWRSLTAKFSPIYDLRTGVFAFAHEIEREQGLSLWRSTVSSLVIPIFRAWEKGDDSAREIATAAAKQLVSQLCDIHDLSGASLNAGPIVLYGGCINHWENFRQLIVEQIRKVASGQSCTFIGLNDKESMRPVCGALMLALSGSSTMRLRLPTEEISANIYRHQLEYPALKND